MKTNLYNIIAETVSILYICLFVYAAVSKLLDYENFQVQLGQSPLLSAFAGWLSWLVPVIELAIAMLLVFRCTRTFAQFCGYTLMVMFTAYIYIMLNYSSYTPCSCGGVLEKMSWETHLLFNFGFMIIGAAAIIITPKTVTNISR
jgi:uncharacterized membrane protein YphA (DoxX/SURF4 family)